MIKAETSSVELPMFIANNSFNARNVVLHLYLFKQASVADRLVLKSHICCIWLPSYVIESSYGV
jgi:hypothetical protein